MTNRKIAVVLAVLLMCLLTAGCLKQTEKNTETNQTKEDLSGKKYTIAISQFADHTAMEKCKDGFLETLSDVGIVENQNLTLVYQNAGGDKERAKLIAASFAANPPDLIYCVGSTSASVTLEAVRTAGVPIVFAAVTDPVSAELADEDGVQRDNITGISAQVSPQKQLELIQQILPDAKKIGIIYSEDEVNAVTTVESYRSCVSSYDMELVLKPVKTTYDIGAAADELLNEADCILNIQDSMVTGKLSDILEKSMQKLIPVFGSDQNQAEKGCIASFGEDYSAAGKKAGELAVRILKGEAKVSQLSFISEESEEICLNQEAAALLNITIPDTVMDEAKETYDKIGEQGEEE
ncbi:MAG: ABC transporter substrate-binding protein [Hespellia sp.]|nr:ABC transporter substrate-binding protein [Hespellia sp.]